MRIALVTGASSGLGREFVRQLAHEPGLDEIWVVARRRERLEELRAACPLPVRVLALDLTRPECMDTLRRVLAEHKPNLRVLVNAAGMGRIGPADARVEDIDRLAGKQNGENFCHVRMIGIVFVEYGFNLRLILFVNLKASLGDAVPQKRNGHRPGIPVVLCLFRQ